MNEALTEFPEEAVNSAKAATSAGESDMATLVTAEDFARLEEEKAERRRRKEIERTDESRVLDPWERYRALSDHCDGAIDLTELYDRKTRFALLILTGLNAMNLLVVAKTDAFTAAQRPGPFLVAYIVCYVLISLYLFAYAIAALRPRRWTMEHPTHADAMKSPPGLRMTRNILDQELEEYCENW